MSDHHLPVRPNLRQLKVQAKELLRAMRQQEPDAKLADAQHALARGYGVRSWPRLVQACDLVDAIWNDDVETVVAMMRRHPELLHEMARGVESCNWGPPMTYAANLGRDRIIDALYALGAKDVMRALSRAVIQSRLDTARKLHVMAGRPRMPKGTLIGAAETLSVVGARLLFEAGVTLADDTGDWRDPVAMVLDTYGRHPERKHQLLELMVEHGARLPETPPMAVHRGRIDLLERHLQGDPALLSRTFPIDEIFPSVELRCEEPFFGSPLDGATLLHICMDYDEFDIARWLLDRGMSPDARAAVDVDGFGGHTPLFGAVTSYHYYVKAKYATHEDDSLARLLLDRGADPNVRVSLRRRGPHDEVEREYLKVTPLSWGRRFAHQELVNPRAIRLIEERGGCE